MFLGNWKKIYNDTETLEIISGHQIVFQEKPVQKNRPKPFQLSGTEEQLVDQEIETLLKKGFLLNTFTISKRGGARRPVIDL